MPFWPVTTPRGYLGWGKSTQLGYGLGLALGAKMAAPDKTVINIMGDAAFGMAGLDIETAARSNIGTLTIILNNGVMTHYYDHFPHATEHWGSNKLGGEYAKVAEGLGAYAERVDNPDEVNGAIKRALEATQEDPSRRPRNDDQGRGEHIPLLALNTPSGSAFRQAYWDLLHPNLLSP